MRAKLSKMTPLGVFLCEESIVNTENASLTLINEGSMYFASIHLPLPWIRAREAFSWVGNARNRFSHRKTLKRFRQHSLLVRVFFYFLFNTLTPPLNQGQESKFRKDSTQSTIAGKLLINPVYTVWILMFTERKSSLKNFTVRFSNVIFAFFHQLFPKNFCFI